MGPKGHRNKAHVSICGTGRGLFCLSGPDNLLDYSMPRASSAEGGHEEDFSD
jgi:hypothetical protein